MADWYCSSAAYAGYTPWSAGATHSVGNIVVPTAPAAGAKYVFRCSAITTGVSSGTQPTWPTSNNATVVDGGVTWTNVTGQSTYFWAAAAGDIVSLIASPIRPASGDRVFVSSDHSETQTTITRLGAYNIAGTSVLQYISVNRGGSTPPVAADVTAGAAISVNSTNDMVFVCDSPTYHNGFTFEVTDSSAFTGMEFAINSNNYTQYFANCTLWLNNTARNFIGPVNATKVVLDSCNVKFGASTQSINVNTGASLAFDLTWFNGAVQGTAPTTLFTGGSGGLAGPIVLRGVDVSLVTGTLVGNGSGDGGKYLFESCKISQFVARYSRASNANMLDEVELVNCYDGTYILSERWTEAGQLTTDTSIYLSGGAQDNVGNFSHKIVTSAVIDQLSNTFDSFWLDVNYTNTGSSHTATVEIASGGTLTNAQISLSLEYEGTSGSSLASFANSAPATPLTTASNVPSSSATWAATGDSVYNFLDLLNCTLSSNLLTVTGTGSGAVRTTSGVSSGKYYFEVTATTIAGTGCGVGIAMGTVSFTSFLSLATGGAVALYTGTNYVNGSSVSGSLGSWSNGDVICVALDLTNNEVWFRRNNGNWNGSGTANPATNTGGYSISGLTSPIYGAMMISNTAAMTANFGQNSFSYSAPSGFTAGLPIQAPSVAQHLQVTFTPQQAGRVRGKVRVGAASQTVWINPQLTIT